MDTNSTRSVLLPPARLRYAHLYMPLITTFLIFTNGGIIGHFSNPNNDRPQDTFLLVAASAIPTYLVASCLYPADRPDPSPEESVRFTRKHDAYRALVLATYGRIFGTPFNLQFLIADFILSYILGSAVGERPAGTRQRRSEFFVAFLWLLGSLVLMCIVPPSMPTLASLVTSIDRTVWRAAYLALVDDIVGVLARPNVRTLRGKITLVLAQSFTITSLMWFALSWMRRLREAEAQYPKGA